MNEMKMGVDEEIVLAPEMKSAEESVLTVTDADRQEDITLAPEEPAHRNVRIREMRRLRDVNRKVFRMSDGTEQAVFYPHAIHTFDDQTGEFEELDHSLSLEEDGRHYRNRRGRFAARFSCEETTDELFSIEQGMCRVTVSAVKNKKQHDRGASRVVHKKDGAVDTLLFENVGNGTDLEYTVAADGVKENILVNTPSYRYRYPFLLHCENVTVRYDKTSKQVAFLSNETGEEVFFIPAPFMQDAKGNVSTAVSYEVKSIDSGDVQFTVTADSDWINAEGREFPVVIDPQIKVSDSNIRTYSWGDGTMYSSPTHIVGTNGTGDGNCNANRMYMRFNMPSLPRNPRIKKAELVLHQKSATCEQNSLRKLGLYRVVEDIASGYCTPASDSDLIDFEPMKTPENNEEIAYAFDITKLVDALSKEEITCSGLMLKLLDESGTSADRIVLYGSSYGYHVPEIRVTYESGYGVNTAYRTHTHELGRFGQGSIDLSCGNLMFEAEDFAWAGNRMPVTIKHLYNSALADNPYTANGDIQLETADFSSMQIGNGWKLNIMQSMMPIDTLPFELDEGDDPAGYVYFGENGETTYFKQSDETVCCDSNTQCYPLFKAMDDETMVYDPQKRTLVQGEDIYLFDGAGRLIRITDTHGNQLNIVYSEDGRLTSVTDGVGRVFEFDYVNSELRSITAPDDEVHTEYYYTNGRLTSVKYPEGKNVVISYNGNKPASVTLQDANGTAVYKVAYTFSGDRITSVTEYGSDDVVGVRTEYAYSAAARRTVVTTTEPVDDGETVANIVKTVYTFNDDGEIVSEYVYSEDTGNVGAIGEESGIHPHSGDGGAGVVSNINNLLLDHGFERLDSWPEMPCNCGDTFVSNSAYAPYAKFGTRLMHMGAVNSACTENGVYQVTNVLPAGPYTFSVYARVISEFSGASRSGAYIRVTDTSGKVLTESEHISKRDSEYVRLIAPFELATAQSVVVQILMDGKGAVYVDAAQLENNPFANAYNLLENGNFEHGTARWQSSGNVGTSAAERFNMSRSLEMTGDLDSLCQAYQTVAVKTDRDIRETFTLSGWAKGYGIPDRSRDGLADARFQLRAVIYYTDCSINKKPIEAVFSPCTEEWQFASIQFAKDAHKRVDHIEVYCDYSHNIGTAYFDDIQLIRDSLETDLTDEDFLDATETEDDTATDTTASGEDDAVETNEPPAFEEYVDRYGNTVTETTFTDGEFGTIYRAFGFSADGNELIRETDARGNETTYAVGERTSRNEEIVDRCGNKTAYVYDDAGRTTKVTSVAAMRDEDGVVVRDAAGDIQYEAESMATVSYAYDTFDNLTEIARGDGLKYVLNYNAFHELESIGIDGKNDGDLVTYTYKNGNGRLKQITYANGHTMKATYNSIGQMVAEKWYDSESATTPIAHYKYVYDGQGNIVRSIDMTARKEYTYTYESGNLTRAAEYNITVGADEIITAKNLVNSIIYVYDAEGNMTRKRIIDGDGNEQTVYYENAEDTNTVTRFTVPDPTESDPDKTRTVTSHSKNDSFGRKVFDELQLGTGFVSRQFSYHAGSIPDEHKDNEKIKSTATTSLVSQIVLSDERTVSYEYDAEERITKVIDSVDGTTEYTYDALGQLLTETVIKDGVSTVVNSMEYDNYGNIKAKNGKVYTYGDSVWKDRLTAFDGTTIEYDAQGNPTNYLGHTLTWEKGRQLKSFDGNTYTYNANGIRTSKTVDGIRHDYVLDGVKILRETWNGNTLTPLYDNEDNVCGIVYNNTPYYFLKNQQGDVVVIADANGDTVARYTYDAWGVCTVKQDISTCGIATINPFRYRGYYYDAEIGMYYLQSRYYDPVLGRFVNTDEVTCLGVSETVMGYNSFVYCENNPVDDSDSEGNLSFKKIKNAISNFFSSIFKAAIKELTNLFKLRNGYLEIKNSVIAGVIDGFIMFVSGIISFGLKAVIKIIVRDFLLKKTPKSKEFLRFLIYKLLTPGTLSVVIAALGFIFKWSKYKIKAYTSDITQNLLNSQTKLLKTVYSIYSAISSIGSFIAFCLDLFDGNPNNYFRIKFA